MSIHRPRMIYLNAIWIALDIEFNKSLIVLQAAFPCIRFADEAHARFQGS